MNRKRHSIIEATFAIAWMLYLMYISVQPIGAGYTTESSVTVEELRLRLEFLEDEIKQLRQLQQDLQNKTSAINSQLLTLQELIQQLLRTTSSPQGTMSSNDNQLTTTTVKPGDENLALRKNAIQSSTYPGLSPVGHATNVVDGITDSQYYQGSCCFTSVTDPTWWAVDLGLEASVGRVRITNNKDTTPPRLSNFYIGLTNVSPWISAPQLNQSSICKFYIGYPPPGVPTDVLCQPGTAPGRYLFILLSLPDVLCFCEVEAYRA